MPYTLSTRKRLGIAAAVLALVLVFGWDNIRQLPLKFRQVGLLFGSRGHGHTHGPRGHGHRHGGSRDADDATHRAAQRVSLPEKIRLDHQLTFATVQTRAAADDEQELAIPRAALLQDGPVQIFWRRDPLDGEAVLRTEADLGPQNGEWVTVYSGVRDGDEVLMGKAQAVARVTSGTGTAHR